MPSQIREDSRLFRSSIIVHEGYSKTKEGFPIGTIKPEVDLKDQANKLEYDFRGKGWEWGIITENSSSSLEEIWNMALRLSFCLDLEHSYRTTHVQPAKMLESFAKRWRKQLSYLKDENYCFCKDLYKYPLNVLFHHIHVSNHLNGVGHLPLKHGEIDYKKVFDVLKKYNFGDIGNETITVETPPDDTDSIKFVKSFFN